MYKKAHIDKLRGKLDYELKLSYKKGNLILSHYTYIYEI